MPHRPFARPLDDPLARFHVLLADAEQRRLTPQAWWLGRAHHDELRATLAEHGQVVLDGPRLLTVLDLPVKVLSESPDRFALWCREGTLDL